MNTKSLSGSKTSEDNFLFKWYISIPFATLLSGISIVIGSSICNPWLLGGAPTTWQTPGESINILFVLGAILGLILTFAVLYILFLIELPQPKKFLLTVSIAPVAIFIFIIHDRWTDIKDNLAHKTSTQLRSHASQ